MYTSDDQEMLAKSVRDLLTKKSNSAAVRTAMESPDRFDRALWRLLCEQIGAGGIAIAEEFGGAGGGAVDALIVAEELGRSLTPSPMLGSAGIAAALVAATDDADTKARLLSGIADGTTIVSVCIADASGRWIGSKSSIDVVEEDSTLNGSAHFVLDAAAADVFLVVAGSAESLAIYEVDARETGVSVSGGKTMDATRALYEVTFDRALGRRIAVADPTGALTNAVSWGMILLAGEQAGAAARCLELTVDYTKSRVQFGRPIGSFQALKHRMADLHVLTQSARATAYSAATAYDTGGSAYTDAAVAKVYCSEAFSAVAAECVQLHGGIAITWEHDMQLYFKRAHSSSQLFGQPRHHLTALNDEVVARSGEDEAIASHSEVAGTNRTSRSGSERA